MSASWDMASAPPAAHPMNLTDIDWSATEADQFFNTGDNNTMNNDNNGGGVAGKDANDMLLVDPRDIRRAETAPMVLTIVAADGTLCVGGLESEAAPGEEYRYTEEYHLLYYSKNPRDPRMLPPLNRRGQLPIHRSSNNTNTNNNNTAILHSSGAQKGTTNNAAIAEGTVSNSTSLGSGLNHHMEDSEHERKGSNSNIAAAVHSSEQQQQQQPTIINPLQPTTTTTSSNNNNNNNNTTNGPKRLAEYVSSGRPEWDYAHIRSFISEFSRDQDGSRLVQRLLEKHDNIAPIFDEIMADFEGIVTDVFGNYVLQKLFDEAAKSAASASATEVDADQNSAAAAAILSKLTAIVRGNFKRYSTQTYSCRVIQKALENMRPTDRNEIIHEFDDCVVECVLDQNANHVVQKIIEVCPQECQFIIDAFLPRLSDLACHAYGCRVLQRAFERCHDVPEVNIIPLLEAVLAHVSEFNIHQYGNYVVQHGMLNSPEPLRKKFIEKLMPQVYALSCSKFGSNVAEKVVSTANDAERDAIIEILTKPLGDSQGGNYLVHMMQDTYANYVVQRFLECSSTAQRAAIGEHVKPHVDSANQTVYGRFLLRKMELMGVLSREYLFEHGIDVTAPEYGGVNGNMHPNGGSGNRKRNNNNNNSGKHSRNNNNNNNNMNNNNANTNNNNNNNNSSNRMGRQNVHSAMPPPAMPAPPTLHYSPQQQPFNLVPVYGSYSTAVYSPAGYAQPQQQQPQPQHQQPTAQAPQGVYYNSAYAQAPAPGPSTEYHYAQPQYALSAAPAPTAPPQGYMQPQPTMMGFSGGYTMGPAAPAGGYGQINVTVHGGGQRRGKRNDYGL